MGKLLSSQTNVSSSFGLTAIEMSHLDPHQRAWLEIDSFALESNARLLKNYLKEDCLLMAVVKADGYGHGAETVANAALRGGADNLGVATLREGIDLRQAGFDCKILILGNLINKEELASCLCWDLIPTLSSIREAIICQNVAEKLNKQFNVHLKIDTGMTRLGCGLEEVSELVAKIDCMNNLHLEGLYSHLALADEEIARELKPSNITEMQRIKFEKVIQEIRVKRKSVCCHLANSAGTLRGQHLHYDMVRVGLALYGYSPNNKLGLDLDLNPALSVKARITLIRNVPSGTGVGYGHNFITKRHSRLAVVAIGYADGISRSLSGKIFASINGELVPQVGSITMDQLVLDITDKPNVKIGNIVTLLGRDKNQLISATEWGSISGSIPWEVLCGFKHRLPRVVI